jgi:hypothetical protein
MVPDGVGPTAVVTTSAQTPKGACEHHHRNRWLGELVGSREVRMVDSVSRSVVSRMLRSRGPSYPALVPDRPIVALAVPETLSGAHSEWPDPGAAG